MRRQRVGEGGVAASAGPILAESDWEGIRDLAEREPAWHLCRSKLAEVLEKVLKAELLRCGWFLEKIHDLMRLLVEIEK